MRHKSYNIALVIVGIMTLFIFSQCVLAEEIKVAIIDSGAKGYVDEAISFTSYAGTEDPLDHGTQIARLVRRDYPDARIYMLQVCEKIDGVLKPSKEAIVKAIDWAVSQDIDIVNMSLAIRYDQEIERAIVHAATSHGIIFVAASGNKSIASQFAADSNGFIRKVNKTIRPAFPSSSEHVISVGAVDKYGRLSEYSSKSCDIYEQGEILGQRGTSFASARVTAKVAKILSARPGVDKRTIVSLLQE